MPLILPRVKRNDAKRLHATADSAAKYLSTRGMCGSSVQLLRDEVDVRKYCLDVAALSTEHFEQCVVYSPAEPLNLPSCHVAALSHEDCLVALTDLLTGELQHVAINIYSTMRRSSEPTLALKFDDAVALRWPEGVPPEMQHQVETTWDLLQRGLSVSQYAKTGAGEPAKLDLAHCVLFSLTTDQDSSPHRTLAVVHLEGSTCEDKMVELVRRMWYQSLQSAVTVLVASSSEDALLRLPVRGGYGSSRLGRKMALRDPYVHHSDRAALS